MHDSDLATAKSTMGTVSDRVSDILYDGECNLL